MAVITINKLTPYNKVMEYKMATPLEAIKQVANQNLGFYAFCFADEIAMSEVKDLVQWAETNNRAYITVMTDKSEAATTANELELLDLRSKLITYHEDYTVVGAVAGMALDQRYDRVDGVKTLNMKGLKGVASSGITQTEAEELKAAGVNYYSDYGNPDNSLPVFTNGYAGGGYYFDFVMGIDWLRNNVETHVFNGQRLRRSTPQTNKGMMMIKADIITALEQGVAAGLIAGGTWNGQSVGEVEAGDYLTNGYYIHHEYISEQSQEDRQNRISPPFTILVKGAGALHGVDITIIPQA